MEKNDRYQIEVEYFTTEYGQVFAGLRTIQFPEYLGGGLFNGDDDICTRAFESWEALEKYLDGLLYDAEKEANRRRALRANRPAKRIVEL